MPSYSQPQLYQQQQQLTRAPIKPNEINARQLLLSNKDILVKANFKGKDLNNYLANSMLIAIVFVFVVLFASLQFVLIVLSCTLLSSCLLKRNPID
jgi:hypothetical protein